ncbi:glycosyltransferase family 2 protein [Litorivicinus sp.]|nr:glycosyltransferase family 2 protein [Litorivicinus sp.]
MKKNDKKLTQQVITMSVIIPYFNDSKTIKDTLDSVMAQTVSPHEIIIVDDGSTEDEFLYLQKLISLKSKRAIKILLFRMDRNQGVASARNFGWSRAASDWISFLDADDFWHKRKIEIITGYLILNPQIIVMGHRKIIQKTFSNEWRLEQQPELTNVSFKMLLVKNQFTTSSSVLKRATAHRFSEGMRHMEDHRLWLDIAFYDRNSVWVLDLPLVAHRKHDYGVSGLSSNLWKMEYGELCNYFNIVKYQPFLIFLLPILLPFSVLKFLRRLVITFHRTCHKFE